MHPCVFDCLCMCMRVFVCVCAFGLLDVCAPEYVFV